MLKTYKVEGMTCGGCAEAVENAIRAALPPQVMPSTL